MQVSTCLVDAYEDYNYFGEVSFFRLVDSFKMEQRRATKICVKLKKTVIERFEMLKSVYGEEYLSRTSVFIEAQKVRVEKRWVKTMLTAFFNAKSIIHHEFVAEIS
jgi:hypothetical protein